MVDVKPTNDDSCAYDALHYCFPNNVSNISQMIKITEQQGEWSNVQIEQVCEELKLNLILIIGKDMMIMHYNETSQIYKVISLYVINEQNHWAPSEVFFTSNGLLPWVPFNHRNY